MKKMVAKVVKVEKIDKEIVKIKKMSKNFFKLRKYREKLLNLQKLKKGENDGKLVGFKKKVVWKAVVFKKMVASVEKAQICPLSSPELNGPRLSPGFLTRTRLALRFNFYTGGRTKI